MGLEQLREERDKVLYLERVHQDLSAEGLKVVGQRAELGAVRHQVERLTRDRKKYLEELQLGARCNPENSVPVEGSPFVMRDPESDASIGRTSPGCNTVYSNNPTRPTQLESSYFVG